jgi:hypothetical protein
MTCGKPYLKINIYVRSAFIKLRLIMALTFLERIVKCEGDFLDCGTFKIKDGSQTRLWEDIFGLALNH